MEFNDVVRSRAMTRSFSDAQIDQATVALLLDDALRGPTAGNTRATAFVALCSKSQRQAYWSAATDAAWRERSSRFEGMARAPVIVLALSRPDAYAERYAQADKAGDGLDDVDAWPLPYWHTDAAFATMALLLGATNLGLGACFLGAFRNIDAVRACAEIPSSWAVFGTVLLGHSDSDGGRSRSLGRSTISRSSRIWFDTFGTSEV